MNELTATWRLVRHALRRDRIILPVWIVSLAGLTTAIVAAQVAMYLSEAERAAGVAFGAANSMTRIFDGPASGTHVGAVAWVEAGAKLAVFVALMSAQAVVRHTRQDEETGRAELIGSAVVGRQARLAAALIVATGASVVVGAAVTAALLANGLPLAGSLVAGGALAGVGACFAGVAGIAAQASTTQRGANSLAGAAVGAAFLLRAVGDTFGTVGPSGLELVSAWPSWASPIGWLQQTRPFSQNNAAILILFASLAVSLVAVAFRLSSRRDVGAGLLRERPGPASASARLLSPRGLAWRLQALPLAGWTFGLVVTGAAMGAAGDGMQQFANDNPQFRDLLLAVAPNGTVIELFFALIMAFVAVAAAGYIVQALLRMRAEESSGRLEPLLSTAVSRRAWLASHGWIAAGGAAVVILCAGLAGTLGYGVVTGDLSVGLGMTVAAAAQLPAVFALGGFVLGMFALAPRLAGPVSWAALAGSLVVGQFGDLLKLPQWLINVSPFTHVSAAPAESFAPLPTVLLLTVAAGFTVLAVVAFRRRDLAIAA